MSAIEELEEFVGKKLVIEKREKLLELLQQLQQLEKSKQELSVDQWNQLDGRGAKELWELVKLVLKQHGWDLCNRSIARHIEDEDIRPQGLYLSYTDANTIINGALRKIVTLYHEKCNKYDFCWKGLEGFCHKKTSRGVSGFTLDNSEGIKLPAITQTVRTIADGRLTPDMVSFVRLRKSIPIYYISERSKANAVLTEDNQTLRQKIIPTFWQGREEKVTLGKAVDYQVVSIIRLLEDTYWIDELVLNHRGKTIQPWLLAVEGRLGELTIAQQLQVKESIRKILTQAKGYFKPFRYQLEDSEEWSNWHL